MLLRKNSVAKLLPLLLIALTLFITSGIVEANTKVAIMGLNNSTDRYLRGFEELSHTILNSLLAETESFTVVERRYLEKIIEEQKNSLTGLFDRKESSIELGKLLTADYLLIGSLNSFEFETSTFSGYGTTSTRVNASVSGVIELINTTTGALDFSSPFSANTLESSPSNKAPDQRTILENLLKQALRKAVNNLVEKSTKGNVTAVEQFVDYYIQINSVPQGAKVYIDEEYVGDTPLSTFVQQNVAQIKIIHKDLEPWIRELQLFDGLTINAVLQ